MVEHLEKENLSMPKGCIMDLVKMYNQMTPEQRERFDEEMDKYDPNPMEKCLGNEFDGTSVLHFASNVEADEYLRGEGKLLEDGNEDITD